MNYFFQHKEGFWGTIIVHAIVLILMLFLGFFKPLNLPGENGILINFGTSEAGLGRTEPAPAPKQTEARPAEEKKQPVQQPPPPTPAKAVPATTKNEKEIMTQDYEKTVALEAARKKEQEEKKRTEEINKQKALALAEQKKREEEIDKQRILEEQRLQKEKLEKERLAEIARKTQEEERQRKEAEQKRIAEINSMAANAFGAGGAGNEGSKSTSQGVTYPAGNQGNPQGSAGPDNYGNGANGQGTTGKGPSFSLAGRNALSLPKPDYPGNEEGVIVVAVTVDNLGNVTNAEAGVQGSTTYNSNLLDAAKKAALKARFNAAPNASSQQKGTITYRFILD